MYLNGNKHLSIDTHFGVKPGHEMYLNYYHQSFPKPIRFVKPGHEMYLNVEDLNEMRNYDSS